jgi:hypothetical protein
MFEGSWATLGSFPLKTASSERMLNRGNIFRLEARKTFTGSVGEGIPLSGHCRIATPFNRCYRRGTRQRWNEE